MKTTPANLESLSGWAAALVLSLGILLASATVTAQSSESKPSEQGQFTVPNPGADLWKAVRAANPGNTQVQGVETGVLINSSGESWRQMRNGPIRRYTGWLLSGTLLWILLFFAVRRSVKLEHGRSGITVARWSVLERTMHWYTASLFIVLAITGLSIMFGRSLVIPVIGNAAFGVWADFAKNLHNYLGPFFSIGVFLIIVLWMRHNIPNLVDLAWMEQGGGIIGNKHPSAGRMNAGEKVWFWIICTVGVTVIGTGFYLDFPEWFQLARADFQIYQIVHSATACLWIAVFFGHAYIGTVGSEGSIEAMTKGRVDVNWAKQHHDLWYEEVKNLPAEDSPPEDDIDHSNDETVVKPRPS